MSSVQRRGGSALVPGAFALVPTLLGAACVVLYVFTVRLTSSMGVDESLDLTPSPLALARFGAMFSPFVRLGEWWRTITAIFLHGDLVHLVMNGVGLFAVATVAEQRFGRARTFVAFVVTGAAGEAASALWYPVGLSIGASGGIFGLMGVCVVSAVRRRDAELRARFVPWLIYGLVVGIAASGRIDNAAHVGGLTAGALLGLGLGDEAARRRLPDWVWTGVSLLLLAGLLGAFALAARSPLPDLAR